MKWHSQAGQDEWVVSMTGRMRGGYFANVGAYDGLESDNTATLEFELGWAGVCIEANPQYADRCKANRQCTVINAAVIGDRCGVNTMWFQDQLPSENLTGIEVRCATLDELLVEAHAPDVIDYMSLDIEGFELEALAVHDFERWRIRLMTVEHNNYRDGPKYKDDLHALLTSRGMIRVVEDAPCRGAGYEGAPFEDWYAIGHTWSAVPT